MVHGRAVSARLAGLAVSVMVSTSSLAADDAQFAQGRALFTKDAVPLCAACHTLQDAGSQGAIGPVLDELKPNAPRVEKALRNGIGNMPSFSGILSDVQIRALARYVSKASGGSS
jgi:cytochrome c6